ncbi:MAG: nucleotide exchange factor GrpE [Candidatus Pacebacteria bacterium]|nr:nucleotide exchange factor GrpE [Candidatus Paceibacterota bacterium]
MKDTNFKNEEEMLENDVDNQRENEDDVVFEDLNSDGEVMSESQKIKNDKNKLKDKFEEKIERLEKERDEYLKGWQRIQADYKNREKEIEEYKRDLIKFANSNLIKDLLPVFDGYDMAKNNKSQWESVDQNWRVGIEYLFSQLLKVLESNGVKVFGEEGEDYDPSIHEAVEIINLNLEEKDKNDKIISVIQKGYKIGEKILRPARVKVGKSEE